MADIKTMSIRIPKELWAFIKKQSIVQEKHMNVIITEQLLKLKKDIRKKD